MVKIGTVGVLWAFLMISPVFCQGQEMTLQGGCSEAVTTVEMQVCLREKQVNAECRLADHFERLLLLVTPKQQQLLREAQSAWLLYRDQSAAFEASLEEGTLFSLVYLTVMVDKTENRVQELEKTRQQVGLPDER